MPKTPWKEPRLSDLLSARDVCEWADIDRATLTRHIQQGKISPAHRLGDHRNAVMLFDRPAVAAYIAETSPERLR
jgi:hypothetical protein